MNLLITTAKKKASDITSISLDQAVLLDLDLFLCSSCSIPWGKSDVKRCAELLLFSL